MKFNSWVWLTQEMEGSANGDTLLKGLESLVGDTKEYINKLENEIERLEYLLDTNEINY